MPQVLRIFLSPTLSKTSALKLSNRAWNVVFPTVAVWLLGVVVMPAQSFQKPALIVETGHSDISFTIALNPDGKVFASAGDDNVVRLWDLQSGRELAALYGHTDDVKAVVFSADGKYLASGSWDNTVKLWDIRRRAEIHSFQAASEVLTLRFSANGKMLAAVDVGNKFTIWNVETHKEILANQKFKVKSVFVTFSPDNKMLAFGDENSVINFIDLQTGRIIRTFKGHESLIVSIVFSRDGNQLVSGDFEGFVKFWNVSTETVLKTIRAHENYVSMIILRADGKQFLTASGDHQIKLWDAENDRVIRTFQGHDNDVTSIDVSSDWKILISTGEDEKINIWKLETGEEVQRIKSRAEEIRELALSPDGNTFALFNSSGDLKLWQFGTGQEVQNYEGRSGRYAFSTDGKRLAFGGEDDDIVIVDPTSGRVLRKLPGDAHLFAFSPDDETLASTGADGVIRLRSLKTGEVLGKLEGHAKPVSAIDFEQKGKRLASVDEAGDVFIWDLGTRTGKKISENASYGQGVIKFSPDGKLLATAGYDRAGVKIIDIDGRAPAFSLAGHNNSVLAVCFSPDGKMLASGSFGKELKLWNLETKTEVMSDKLPAWVRLNADTFAVANFNGRMIRAERDNQFIRIKNADSGEEIIQLVVMDERDWLAATPDGLFDGTPAAWKQLIWRFNNDTFDYAAVETFFNDFFYPELLKEIFEGKQPKAPRAFTDIDRRQPLIKIKIETTADPQSLSRTVRVQVSATEKPAEKSMKMPKRNGEVRDLRLSRNDSLVKIWHGETIDQIIKLNKSECFAKRTAKNEGRTITCQTNVPIVAGQNKFTAYAFNRDNVKSPDDTAQIEGKFEKKDATLYILAVGIDRYVNPDFNLPFSVSGITQISQAIKNQQDLLIDDSQFRQFTATKIITLKDETATKTNILEALKAFTLDGQANKPPVRSCDELAEKGCRELKEELSKIKPTAPEDALIIYFLGHGTSLAERFYFLPHNFTFDGSRESYANDAVSDLELNELLERVDAGKLLMIIDSCRSGQALGDEKQGYAPMNSKGLAQLAYDKGMVILTASQNVQKANQTENINGRKFQSSLLSFALQEGLTNLEADKNEDKTIGVREWFNYASRQVPILYNQATRESASGQLIGLGYLNDDFYRNLDPRLQAQTPRIFYRRTPEKNPFVVSRIP